MQNPGCIWLDSPPFTSPTCFFITLSAFSRIHLLSAASQQFTRLDTSPVPLLTTWSRSHVCRIHSSCYSSNLLLPFLLLARDIELNPGPSAPFTVCSLNISSILNFAHSVALADLADSHHPDLFCLTKTWIKPSTISAELIDCTIPGYSLLSQPRPSSSQKSQNVDGGLAFLLKLPFDQLPSTVSAYKSFEAFAVTLKLRTSKLTVFNVYRPPNSYNYAKLSFWKNFMPSYALLQQHLTSS